MLNCNKKSIHFLSDPKPSQEKSIFLIAFQISHNIEKGDQAYLVLTNLSVDIKLEINKITVVNQFPELFAAVDIRLSSNREIELLIDLFPDTRPISIAPYIMPYHY